MEVPTVFRQNGRMDCRKQAHAIYCTRYHIVVPTRYRRERLKIGVGDYLKKLVQSNLTERSENLGGLPPCWIV